MLLLTLATIGCRGSAPGPLVFCAASLEPLVRDTSEAMALDCSLQIAGSRVLVTQIKSGASPSILFLADERLNAEIPSELVVHQTIFAANKLVLVKAKRDSRTYDAQSLLDPELKLIVANPDSAPLGLYSKQALAARGARLQTIPAKDATAVSTGLVLGHAQLGIVYWSDAARLDELEVVTEFSPQEHDPINYRALLLKPLDPRAKQLYENLTNDGDNTLVRHHLLAPSKR